MFQGNSKMFMLKEDRCKNDEPLWLIYHDYHREYQILGGGGYEHATVSITPAFNARKVALDLFNSIKENHK